MFEYSKNLIYGLTFVYQSLLLAKFTDDDNLMEHMASRVVTPMQDPTRSVEDSEEYTRRT